MKENQPQTLPVYPVQYVPNTQDEISLVDIWLTMRKHRKLFLITAAGVTLLGLILALLLPKTYGLHTSLEIGTDIREGIPTPIESPETVKAKLENSLIPRVKNKLNADKEEIIKYKVGVEIPKDSSLVVLSSKTSKKHEGIYKELHRKIVDAISQDHSKFTDVIRNNLQFELALANILLDEMQDPTTLEALIKHQHMMLAKAKADLGILSDPDILGARIKTEEREIQSEKDTLVSLKDQSIVLNQELKQINTNQELITSQIKELETELQGALISKRNSAQDIKSETSAMAQLMLDNEVQQNRKWLAELKERSIITLENEKAKTQVALDANDRAQRLQLSKIAEAEANLKSFIGSNLLEQSKLIASSAKIEADIAQLISAQKRGIATQQQAVGEIQAKLDSLMNTHALTEPTLSSEPSSPSKVIILLIAMLLGGILGIATVFFAELREKAAKTITEQ